MMSLQDVLTLGPRQALWILLGATGVVLLIACVNVANLLLVRAVTRQKEMAVRTALGAGQGRLMRQMVTETVLLSIVGGLLGLALAAGLLRLFQAHRARQLPASRRRRPRRLAFSASRSRCAAAAGLLAAMHSGVAGGKRRAERCASRDARAARPPAGPRSVSRLLVMGEIAMAVMLVAAAGLTIRSLQQLLQQDLGFTTRGVLTFTVSITDARRNDPPGARTVLRVTRTAARCAAGCRVRGRDQHAADRADRHQRSGPTAGPRHQAGGIAAGRTARGSRRATTAPSACR